MVLRLAALLAVAVAAGNAAADVRADAGKSHEDGGADRTIVHDGLLTLDRKEIPGITGGAYRRPAVPQYPDFRTETLNPIGKTSENPCNLARREVI